MKRGILICIASLSAVLTNPLLAVTIGQIDTFEDGTTQGWTAGSGFISGANPVPPVNVATLGPQGAGDSFLLLRALGGNGAGSRLNAFNSAQWAGNYTAAGVTAIEMDVRNFSESDLFLRLLFIDLPPLSPPNHLAFSAEAIRIPANTAWMHIRFGITPADLLGSAFGSVEGALANTTELRIYHSLDAAFPIPSSMTTPGITAHVGVDNIQASVPDAGSTALLFAAGALLMIAAERRNRSASML